MLLEGAALLCVVCGVLFWLTLGLDWAYFRLTALELPRWFREAIAVAAVVLIVCGCCSGLSCDTLPASGRVPSALVLEKRFPELGMRLITAVEMAEAQSDRKSPLTSAMLERTDRRGGPHFVGPAARIGLRPDPPAAGSRRRRLAGGLRRDFQRRRGRRRIPLGARFRQTRWSLYRPRETQLIVKAIAQPGDREREFQNNQLKHPRGVDLVLMVEAREGSKVPATVQLDYTLDGGRGTGSMELSKSDNGKFRHSISALLDSLSLWVSGGDYVSRTPLRVEVVDAPRLDQVTLDCDYPDYTGLDRDSTGAVSRDTVEVQSSQVSLPMETAFLLRASQQAARRPAN